MQVAKHNSGIGFGDCSSATPPQRSLTPPTWTSRGGRRSQSACGRLLGDGLIAVGSGPVDGRADQTEYQALQRRREQRRPRRPVEVFGIRRCLIGGGDVFPDLLESRSGQQSPRHAGGERQRHVQRFGSSAHGHLLSQHVLAHSQASLEYPAVRPPNRLRPLPQTTGGAGRRCAITDGAVAAA